MIYPTSDQSFDHGKMGKIRGKTEKGKQVYMKHQKFHEELVKSIVDRLDEREKILLEKVLSNLNGYFREMQQK